MNHKTNRKGLSLLLILAMLFVGISVLLPVAVSADPAEIDDVGYQTLSDLDLADDEDTDLRFFFTIGKLTYDEVGFVFSKSNATPTIDGANCYKKSVDTVYSTITANGTPMAAGTGRYWAAVKMTNIPHAYFDGSLYVRPYVIDGGVTNYDNAQSLTVCLAKGHTHEIDEFKHERTGGTATLEAQGTMIGHCAGCNLDVTINNVKSEIESRKWNHGNSNKRWYDRRQVSDILAGGKHFYPDSSNGGLGNDLYVEYSVLWNETLLNLSNSTNDGARIETRFDTTEDGMSEGYRSIAYWSLTNNVKDSGSKIAGAFEYPSGQIKTSLPGNPYPGMIAGGGAYSAYPNIGGTNQASPEYGWHRVGVVYHEEVTNLAAVRDNGASAQYQLTVTVYIDGEVVSILGGTNLDSQGNDYKLYTVVSDGHGGLTYTDINSDIYVFAFLIDYVNAPSQDAYFADGDVFVTAGHGFVHPVTRVNNPTSRSENIQGQNLDGAFYYATCTQHTYGDWSRIVEPTLISKGLERRTCSICSGVEEREASFVPTVYNSSATNNDFKIVKSVTTARGSDHFYPASSNNQAGRDLYFEMDILWNETITTKWVDNDGIRIELVNNNETRDNLFLLAPKNNSWGSCDAKASGGFDYGWAATHNITYGPKGVNGAGTNAENFPNIGAYGWHRIGVRVHEEAAVSGNGVAYTVDSTLYIDGTKVWAIHYSGDLSQWSTTKQILLFTATNVDSNLNYTDNASNLEVHVSGWNVNTVDGVYVPYGDAKLRAVPVNFDPSCEIERINDPDEATYTLPNDTEISAKVFFQAK